MTDERSPIQPQQRSLIKSDGNAIDRLKQSFAQPAPASIKVSNQSLIKSMAPHKAKALADQQFIGVIGIVGTLVAWIPLLTVSIIGGEPTSLAQWLGMGFAGFFLLCFGTWMTQRVNRAVDRVLPVTGSSDYRWKITPHGDDVKATLMYIDATPKRQWNFRVESQSDVRYIHSEIFETVESCEAFIARANAEIVIGHQLQLADEQPAIDEDVQEQLLSRYQRGLKPSGQQLGSSSTVQLPSSKS